MMSLLGLKTNLFARKLALHKLHKNNVSTPQNEALAAEILESLFNESSGLSDMVSAPLSSLKPRSKCTPSLSRYKFIDTFVELVTQDLQNPRMNHRPHGNLTEDEITDLNELASHLSLQVRRAICCRHLETAIRDRAN